MALPGSNGIVRQQMAQPGSDGTARQCIAHASSGWHSQAADGTAGQQQLCSLSPAHEWSGSNPS